MAIKVGEWVKTGIKTTNPWEKELEIRVSPPILKEGEEVGLIAGDRAIYIFKKDLPRLIEKLKEVL